MSVEPIHADTARNRRIDVRVEETDDGRREVVLRDLDWGEGLGWYVQKTVRLDSAHVDALMGALCCARQNLGASATTAGRDCECNGARPPAALQTRILRLSSTKGKERTKAVS